LVQCLYLKCRFSFLIQIMKKLSLLLILSTICIFAFSQDRVKKVPSAKVKDLRGKMVDTGDISNNGKPMIISFWATWCGPCKKELSAIADVFEEWTEETGVKLLAFSIDDARSASRVLPYVNAQAWEYDVYLDYNQDFKRAMNVNNVPHTFLVDGSGNIVWQHNNYSPGDEDELHEELLKLAK
jgi:cytochrome c biogenesis protein CcmG, thiol:disulfide interchange protein DsbE